MRQSLLLPCFMFLTFGLLSQSKVDSLQIEFSRAKVDSIKILTLHQLFLEYQYDSLIKAKETVLKAIFLATEGHHNRLLAVGFNLNADYFLSHSEFDSAINYYEKGLLIANNFSFRDEKLNAILGLGNSYWSKGNNLKAKNFQKAHQKLAEVTNDENQIANSFVLLASIYSETGEYTQAMEFYIKAAQKFEALKNVRKYAKILGNIGFLNRRLENYDIAISYLSRSDSIYRILDDVSGKAFTAYNLAVVYKNTGDLIKALNYNQSALSAYSQLGDRKRVAYAQYTMGEIYKKRQDFEQALLHYYDSRDISREIKDSINFGYSLIAIGNSYEQLNKNEQAINNLEQALEIANALDQDLIAMEAYESLARIYAYDLNFKKAFENKNSFTKVRDSFYTKEKRELASAIEAKYQNEQKVKEIALLSSDKKFQTLQLEKRINERNTLIVMALIVMIIAGLLYHQFRIKRNANKKLEDFNRLKSQFFANISHDFRTPLTLIKGPIEYLEQNPDAKLSLENVKMIRRNANRLLNMVNQLLDLSKLDEGSLKLVPTEGDVFKCLRAAAASFNSHAAQRNMDYRVEIPATRLWASFDRDKLENIGYNLLGNAFKFSGDGSQILFVANYDEYGLRIQVSDAGKGIAAEKLALIFDRFYQVDSSNTREKGGSGIGLSLSKDLVELMDGTITVISEVDKGTIFTVQLPIQEIKTRQKKVLKDEVHVEKPMLKKPFALMKTDKRNLPNILLVEDNADMRYFITEQLVKFYIVTTAVNGVAGLKKAINVSPDLIITDLMMPKMDGIELCKQLKTELHTSHIPVIMLTAKAGQENKIEGLQTGADDYLTKPFDGKELLVRTKNLIEQRQRLRELFSNKEVNVKPKKITVTSIDQKFLEDVLSLLEKRYSNSDFGVPQMQEALAMSKTQLHRKLKALTNEAPGELLRNFRLKWAAQLLSQKADSVTQIAYKVGFNNLSYFAKCFKELYGVAPSAYRVSG